MCQRRPVRGAYRVFVGHDPPSFLRVFAQDSDSHFESNEGSELSRRVEGTCLAGSLSNSLFWLVCQARKFVTAHLVIVAMFFCMHFFAKLSSSASFRKLHRELGAFSFLLVVQPWLFKQQTQLLLFWQRSLVVPFTVSPAVSET